ncbi:hypothetical protein LPJ78_004371 [Coemansia sp. RSA 989]|nr:hypothetical protein LPJ68_003734 [Coemansia sp. RSA 1086]KAJ1748816.1 hypothetical protein LPJ79_004216 [Coemansia sp. RSA 1821]KAJ1862970.1 hypothetical protein LPJ78_004371 [Coemansia sp. RSA 989]KAJ1870750.1 hypothetical protein LPJ55_004411 [Coemansia sp. RSA 990]KAJ2628899.1 hypothetical protein H4R22_003633 [Coemansia sp. RSA 1290]KAJ2646597.1 hypothetical protein IWW40_005293 [Coemansia sp. RSA 1250]KAJ2668320.1 hypothetical protein IWW42_005292 [Coemansia sp. RSA 1085]
MLRGCLLTLVAVLLVLQFLASLFETALYAGEKIYFDHNNLLYTRGWLYYFKWVIKPLSAALALSLVLQTLCSCCCGGPSKRTGRGGKGYPSILAFCSIVMTALWAVIVGFQLRNDGNTTVSVLVDNTITSGVFVYPLGDGFSLRNDCSASPFTLIEHGKTACRLLLAESGIAIVCLGLWALSFLFALFLFCVVSRKSKIEPA